MPTMGPVQSQVYVDPALSNISIAWQDNRYISDRLFPEVQVPTRTGIYFVYDRSKFRAVNDVRAPGTAAATTNSGLTQASYGPLLDHSLQAVIPWEVMNAAVDPLRPKYTATEDKTQQIVVGKEVDAFKKCTDTAVITQTAAASVQWSDYTNSDPAADVAVMVNVVKKETHKSAKDLTVVMGWEVFDKLRNHTKILPRIQYSQLGIVTEELLAGFFGVKEVIVAEAEYNSTELGQADASSYVWGKNVWVMYVNPSVGIDSFTFGLTLRMGGRTVDGWSDQTIKSDYVRVSDYYEQKVVASFAAYYLSAVVA